MSTPASLPGSVYTGLWTDWTHGRSQGLTLTIPASHAAVLIAFLAIFVRIAGGHLWDVFCYIIFHIRSTTDARDGLHHQQQALLRNNLSDNRAIWQFSSIAWEWRGKTKRPLFRTLPLILSAALHFIAFTAAGIFSSKVASVGSNVLIRGPTCGNWSVPYQGNTFNKSLLTESSELSSWGLSNYKDIAGYVKSCYAFDNATRSLPQDCLAYGRRLPSWSSEVVDCPFADGMCIDGAALELDSGLIDSHLDLGINGRQQDRISFRYRLRCAPITTEGFVTENLNYSQTGLQPSWAAPIDHSSVFTGYSYGQNLDYGINYTFVYDNNTFGWTWCDCLEPAYVISQLPSTAFIPIKSLEQKNADPWMLFIMNSRPVFAEPVNDPVFRADVPFSTIQAYQTGDHTGDFTNVTYFAPAAPVSVVGCASQYQWCNPNEANNCTKLAASKAVDIDGIGYNEKQMRIYARLIQALSYSNIADIASGLGNDALLAGSTSLGSGEVNVPLPNDQWIKELNYWFGMHLTNTQLQVVQYATGTGNAAWDRNWVAPAAEDEWWCVNQIVQRNDYSSISMLGVILILCFGILFVVVNTFLDRVVTAVRSRKHKSVAMSPWRMHHVLQLQSMLYEALGAATWNREALTPVTVDRATFGLPDMEKLDGKSLRSDSLADTTSSWADAPDRRGEKSARSEGVYLQDIPATKPLIWSNDIGRSDGRGLN